MFKGIIKLSGTYIFTNDMTAGSYPLLKAWGAEEAPPPQKKKVTLQINQTGCHLLECVQSALLMTKFTVTVKISVARPWKNKFCK